MSDIEKMTRKSQEAMQSAAQLAEKNGNPAVEPEHLLAGLIEQSEGVVPRILERLQVPGRFSEEVLSRVQKLPQVSGSTQKLMPSSRLTKVFSGAEKEMGDFGDSFISTEHFFLAMLKMKDSDLEALFKKYNIRYENALLQLKEMRGNQKVTDDDPENKYEVLKKYGRDLTELAAEGKLDPVVGRDEEIRRVIQVLSRRTKNNPVLCPGD